MTMTALSAMNDDKRRSPRVPIELWVMVEGVDDFMVKRRGDLSSTGVSFEADRRLAEVGSLEYLHLALGDRSEAVTVMGQLVRVMSIEDEGVGRVAHAFELFPQNEDIRAHLDRFVESAGGVPLLKTIDLTDDVRPADGAVFRLNIDKLAFEATWPVAVGTKVQVALTSPDGRTRIPFEGLVTEVRPDGAMHHVDVAVSEPGVRSAPAVSTLTKAKSITGSIDLLFSEWIASQDLSASPRQHLVGQLDRVPLSGLLTLFDMERMSGELAIGLDAQDYTLFLAEGKLLDIEPAPTEAEMREALHRISSTVSGTFEFRACAVERDDRIQQSTTALLLDLARERDEGVWSD